MAGAMGVGSRGGVRLSPREEDALQGAISAQQKRLQELRQELGDKAEAITRRLFGARLGERVTQWMMTENWTALGAISPDYGEPSYGRHCGTIRSTFTLLDTRRRTNVATVALSSALSTRA